MRGLAKAANVITRSDSYNLTSTEPLVSLFTQMIEAVDSPQWKRSLASLSGLVKATGLGTAHIHVRINSVQLNNAFRAFVHEPWTRDLTERQALARIVEMIGNTPGRDRQFRDVGAGDRDRHPSVRANRPDPEAHRPRHADPLPDRRVRKPGNRADRGLLRQAVRRQRYRRHLAAVRNALGARDAARVLSSACSEEDAYRDYVTKRGRLAIQTGFSDAGRFVGQIAATLAIERLHNGIADLVAKSGIEQRRDADLFDTRRVDGPRCASRRSAAAPALCLLRTNAGATSRVTDWR